MCADIMNLEPHLRDLEKSGCDYIHVDIMDGTFVPNYTLGTELIRRLHQDTRIPLDDRLKFQLIIKLCNFLHSSASPCK